jgi:hypothetical protein
MLKIRIIPILTLCFCFTFSFFATAEEGVYLTKSEFEAFLQQYQGEHLPKPSSGKKLAWKKGNFTITPYGYINLSASYETQRTTTGDYAVYANSPDLDDDADFNVDPKSTRMGFKLESPGIPGWNGSTSEGAIEFDFQGANQSRNRGGFLLRKAFVAVGDGQTKFLAGQDWEVVSPLYPKTLNYTAGACVGNVGYRRAMLRVDHRFDFRNSDHLLTQLAITDNVFRDNITAVSPAASSYPVLQGRLAYSFGKGCFEHGKPITLGISSHLGEQRFEFNKSRKNLKTWSFNVDLDVPITKKLQTNLCYMIDDPFNDDVVSGSAGNDFARNYSHCLFVNALYNWSDSFMTGFEIDFWRTHWQHYDSETKTVTALTPGTPVRYEFTVRYTF